MAECYIMWRNDYMLHSKLLNVRLYVILMALSVPFNCVTSFHKQQLFPQAAHADQKGRNKHEDTLGYTLVHTLAHTLALCNFYHRIAAQALSALRVHVGREKVKCLRQVMAITQRCVSFNSLPDNADLNTWVCVCVRACLCVCVRVILFCYNCNDSGVLNAKRQWAPKRFLHFFRFQWKDSK